MAKAQHMIDDSVLHLAAVVHRDFTLTAGSFGVTPNRTLSGRANYP